MKFCENFETAATCHYLFLIVLTQFLLNLSIYGGAWKFFIIRHYRSMATSTEKFKVHCLGNGSFKFQITFRIHTYIPLVGSGGAAR